MGEHVKKHDFVAWLRECVGYGNYGVGGVVNNVNDGVLCK